VQRAVAFGGECSMEHPTVGKAGGIWHESCTLFKELSTWQNPTESHISALTFVMLIIVLGIGVITSMICALNFLPTASSACSSPIRPACFSSTSGLRGAQLLLVPAGAVSSLRELTIIHRSYAKSIITTLITCATFKNPLPTPQR
jgi:hypothetical protein